MKFQLVSGDIEKKHDCLAIGVYDKGELTPAAKKIDKISRGYLTKRIKQGEITGKLGEAIWLYDVPHLSAERLLIIGCGKADELNPRHFRKIIATSVKTVSASKAKNAVISLTELT